MNDSGQCRIWNLVSAGRNVWVQAAETGVAIYLDPKLNPRCKDCNSMDVDQTYKKVFGCLVCNKCKNEKPEKYSLLTKTECKQVKSSA